MKLSIKFIILLFTCISILMVFNSNKVPNDQIGFSLTVEVKDLRNSNGNIIFALYNREDAFPDEHFKKCLKKVNGEIQNGTSSVSFQNLTGGKYAVSILHDENNNGKIDKRFILPKEGIGFSNYQLVGISNRPEFVKASFNLNTNLNIKVTIIYL